MGAYSINLMKQSSEYLICAVALNIILLQTGCVLVNLVLQLLDELPVRASQIRKCVSFKKCTNEIMSRFNIVTK